MGAANVQAVLNRRLLLGAALGFTVAALGAERSAAVPMPVPVKLGSWWADYRAHDLTGLAELINRRKLSPAEVMEWAIAAAEAIDPTINAISVKFYDRARSQVANRKPDGAFGGVPYIYKDLGISLSGVPFTNGSRLFAGSTGDHDSTIVERGNRAGLIAFALSAAPELGLTGTTESVLHGATRNPWALDRIAGGSSGGAAALVAAGVVPAAHASDYAGSIRTPASCCGLFGLKPSRGRTPTGPARIEDWSGLHQMHAVTRSVRDSALLLDVAAGPEAGSQYVAPPPERSYVAEVSRPVGRLRIAVQRSAGATTRLDPEVSDALGRTARLLQSLGHEVEDAEPPADYETLGRGLAAVLGANVVFVIDQRARVLGRGPDEGDLEPVTWWLYRQGKQVPGDALERASQDFHRTGRAMAAFHQTYDVLLSPTVAQLPLPLGTINLVTDDIDDWVARITAFGPFASLANLTGQPAMSVPLAWSRSGLPIGMMFTGRYGDEAGLFRLAAQLEAAAPWFDRTQDVHRDRPARPTS